MERSVFKKLEKKGIISYDTHHIIVKSIAKLEKESAMGKGTQLLPDAL